MAETTIDKEKTKEISEVIPGVGRQLTEKFRVYLMNNYKIGIYGYDDDEQTQGTQFVFDGKFTEKGKYIEGGRSVDFYFDKKRLILDDTNEDAKKVVAAIDDFINSEKPVEKVSEPAAKPPPPPGPPPFRAPKPAEPAGPPPSRADRFRSMVSTASAQGQVEGGRKTRAKKEPKRKTRKAKKSTRRR